MDITKHHLDAEQCIYQARRFLTACKHGGTEGRGGTLWGAMDLDARICQAAQALAYAHQGVAEAAHAKPEGTEGPTDLQVEASSVADYATRIMAQLAHDVARGALPPTNL